MKNPKINHRKSNLRYSRTYGSASNNCAISAQWRE